MVCSYFVKIAIFQFEKWAPESWDCPPLFPGEAAPEGDVVELHADQGEDEAGDDNQQGDWPGLGECLGNSVAVESDIIIIYVEQGVVHHIEGIGKVPQEGADHLGTFPVRTV